MNQEKMEHIAYALVAKPHTPMYLMHKYWARKPHNVVAEYIKCYSKEGDIVLDPFCGSGPTPLEAIKLGRKAVAVDLDPMATFITRMTGIPADVGKVKAAFNEIKQSCAERINELYKTECGECGKEAIIVCTHWRNSVPLKIMCCCQHCRKRSGKKPNGFDSKLIERIAKMDIPFWYPTSRLAYDGQEFKEGTHDAEINSVDKLFTKRNLISLSILLNEIEGVSNKKVKDVFRFSFTSLSHLASKLTPVRPTRPFSSFWAMHRYWIPPVNMESNVWMLFESAVLGRQGIVSGKTESNEAITAFKETKRFDILTLQRHLDKL